MNKIGVILINASVALYLFASGIMGFSKKSSFFSKDSGGEIGTMVRTIFKKGDFSDVLIIIIAIIFIGAGILVLLSLLKKVEIPFKEIILLVCICVFAAFIIVLDIINPSQKNSLFRENTWEYMRLLASHLLVLGAMVNSTKRFGS